MVFASPLDGYVIDGHKFDFVVDTLATSPMEGNRMIGFIKSKYPKYKEYLGNSAKAKEFSVELREAVKDWRYVDPRQCTSDPAKYLQTVRQLTHNHARTNSPSTILAYIYLSGYDTQDPELNYPVITGMFYPEFVDSYYNKQYPEIWVDLCRYLNRNPNKISWFEYLIILDAGMHLYMHIQNKYDCSDTDTYQKLRDMLTRYNNEGSVGLLDLDNPADDIYACPVSVALIQSYTISPVSVAEKALMTKDDVNAVIAGKSILSGTVEQMFNNAVRECVIANTGEFNSARYAAYRLVRCTEVDATQLSECKTPIQCETLFKEIFKC